MGLPLYVSKNSNSDRDAKNKNCDKIPGIRRSIRRRARLHDLATSRLRQNRALIATRLNDRNSEEDGGDPRDRPFTVGHVELGPLRSRPDRSARTPGSYIASILESMHGGSASMRDLSRAHDDNQGPFSISDALDRAQSLANLSSLHEDADSVPGSWRDHWSTDAPSRSAANRDRTSANTISPWDLYVDGNTREEEERGATHIDGLGDRERSLSPDVDGTWDTLLTTLTPDPQPPSAGSSFASATASNTTSQSPANPAPASQRASRAREPAEHQECGVCERCMIRRANRTALRSRGPPLPPLPLNDILLAESRAQRSRFGSGDYHVRVTSGGLSRRHPSDSPSGTPPGDDNSPGIEAISFDEWTRRQREASRRG